MGKARITRRYVTQRNSGCTSVLSGQGYGPVLLTPHATRQQWLAVFFSNDYNSLKS